MEPTVYVRFREALRMLSFRRHGMAAEALEELVQASADPDCAFWLAYVYRRMRRYERAIEILQSLAGCQDELQTVQAEQRSYDLFRQARELQGRGQWGRTRSLLEQARAQVTDDPDLRRWIEEELELCRSAGLEEGRA